MTFVELLCVVLILHGDGDGDGGEWTYLVPIVFHNLSSYYGHFVLQFFCKEYTEYTTRTGTKSYADVASFR